MRTQHQQRVDEFMRLAGQELPAVPTTEVPDEIRLLRARLILEEALETIEALGIDMNMRCDPFKVCIGNLDLEISRPMNLVEVVDGCCDTIVVSTGTLSAFGVSDDPVQRAIDESNLAKFGPGGYRRDDGKWIKPPDHRPPNILKLLEDQGLVVE
jgi:predicted HAD superfamily Cof-like phosphohydrolase